MTHRSIQERVRDNRAPCSVAGCSRARSGATSHCRHHREAVRRYGHPNGSSLPTREYAAERCEVASILDSNPEHEGVRASVAWLDALLRSASGGRPMVNALELARLARHGVTGRRILEEVAAVWMLAHRRPIRLPDDD